MSEQDLSLKVAMRRLFWRMGFSTRVDVPLRAYISQTRKSTAPRFEEFTDLDVLGIGLGPDFHLETVIADCKTSSKRSTERMFWLRGIGDFFSAHNAYLVRADAVTGAAKQLGSRLGISIVTPQELSLLESSQQAMPLIDSESLGILFDPISVTGQRQALATVDKRLRSLVEYQQFDFWVYEEHRNLMQVVAHLGQARKVLDPSNPVHFSLFMDGAWLYVLSIGRVVQHVRRGHLTDVATGLQEYMFGGPLGLREKQELALVLRRAAGRKQSGPNDVLPPYFPPLLELSTRFMLTPNAIRPCLRFAEWIAAVAVANRATPLKEAFNQHYDDVAGKLLADVCRFLVLAANLPAAFSSKAQKLLAHREIIPEASNEVLKPKSRESSTGTLFTARDEMPE